MIRPIQHALVPLAIACCALAGAGGASAAAQAEMPVTHPSSKAITIKVSTQPAPAGVLVHAVTTGYRFAPEHLSPIHGEGKVVQGEGHGHIYVDGAAAPKLMIVGPWTYLPLKPGKHTIRVTLNANDHNEWTWSGKTVQDSVKVTVPAEMAMG